MAANSYNLLLFSSLDLSLSLFFPLFRPYPPPLFPEPCYLASLLLFPLLLVSSLLFHRSPWPPPPPPSSLTLRSSSSSFSFFHGPCSLGVLLSLPFRLAHTCQPHVHACVLYVFRFISPTPPPPPISSTPWLRSFVRSSFTSSPLRVQTLSFPLSLSLSLSL